MPSFARDYCDVAVLRIFQLGDSEVDDLLLHSLTFRVSRVEMICESPRLIRVARVKKLDHRSRRIHSPGSVDTWSQSETKIVCCHALAISATGNVDQRT